MTTRNLRIATGILGAALTATVALSAQSQPPTQVQPATQSQPPAQPQPPASPGGSSAKTGTTGSNLPRSATPAEYRLAPGDKLRVEVYKDTQLSQSLQVRPDGKVTLPLIGDIVAADLTPIQLRDRISTSLKEYVTNPVVTVIVVEAQPALVHVMGEVNQPGSIPMRGPMTVLQALATAGGFREFANPKDIRVLRPTGNQRQVQTIYFNYKDAIRGDAAPMFLAAGDIVIVP